MAETLSRGESLSPAQRSSMILEKYTSGGDSDKIALLDAAGRATITGFKRSGLMYGLYNAEQLTALESELARREMQPRPSERKNSEPQPAAPKNSGESKKGSGDIAISKSAVRKVITIGLVTTLAAGVGAVIGYGVGHRDNKGAEEEPTGVVADDQEKNDDAELLEQAEDIDVSDQYAGHFANDEGTGYNERKSGRYSFGESLEGAEYEKIMAELEHMAYHEPSLFAAQYFDLDDNAKLMLELEDGTKIDTSKMTMQELDTLMDTNESAHRALASHYLQLVRQHHGMTVLNGQYVNVFGRSTAASGQQFKSTNIEPVNCTTDENGSQAIQFRYEIPGKSGQYAVTTLRLGCGLQVVREKGDPAADKITSTTPDVPDNPPVDEPGGGDPESETSEKKPFSQDEVFREDDAAHEWDNDTTGPGSVGEKPSSSSTTQDMGGGGNTDQKPQSSSESKPATQQQQSASQETSSQKSPEVTKTESEAASRQEAANNNNAQTNKNVENQSDNAVQEHTDSNGNVDLDALLDMD
ncbi:MAG: hypothetical protein K6F57_00825 [Candidatus Saccharibacteria bacterium]|nr:hypothetical protein [Candidatus Saccharibacteria bacterium]